MAYIEQHNQQAPLHGYTLAMNQFGDLTDEEFNALHNGFKMEEDVGAKNTRGTMFQPSPDFVPNNSSSGVDWREKGVVTPVKNQGDCGGCWAFSATGSLEAQHVLSAAAANGSHASLVPLSEQNLMDCTLVKPYNNMACLGGTMDKAFQYIIDNKGVDTEASYPYTAQTEKTCRFNPSNVGATMSSFVDIPINEMALTEACEKVGPISVAIDAGWITFRYYKSGIYYEPRCYTTRLDHGVLVVGYGTNQTTGEEFYWVKNSWGTTWGMEGYVKMARNRDNNCGIASVASYPVV